MDKSFYYIGYSFIEEEKSANQIQSKNTYESLKKINPSFRGIFLGNKNKLLWATRQKKNRYFVDRNDILNYIPENIFKTSLVRKNLFPYLFARKAGKILKKDRNKKNIYTRLAAAEEGIFYLKRLDMLNISRIVFELHNLAFDIPDFYHWDFEKRYCYKKHIELFNLLKNNSQKAKLVTLTESLADIVRDKFDYKEDIEIIPDAHNFITDNPKNINFNKEKIEIIYTGLTFNNRGVECLIEALEFLPDKFYFRLMGGQEQEREDLRKRYYFFMKKNKLILEKPVSHSKIKQNLINADIAILPTPLSGFADFTSPLKLFEYMSVGMPIIVSDLPVLREILTKDNALFFEPNNSRDLAEKIKYLSGNQKLARKIGKNAFEDSKKYTYQKRAEKILKLLNK